MPITFPNLPNQPNLPNANTARPGISHRPIHIGESGKRKPVIAPINHLINEALSWQYQSLVLGGVGNRHIIGSDNIIVTCNLIVICTSTTLRRYER